MEFQAPSSPINLPPILNRLRALLPEEQALYLVGGAVRDLLLGRPIKDYDFALPQGAIPLARRLSNQLEADFYILDKERDIARVLLDAEGGRTTLDFSAYRAEDLEGDLRARDFTLNAIAIDLHQPQALLDPLGGAPDLMARRLKACSPEAFTRDPIRVLRAIRMAASLGLKIEIDTRQAMRQAAPLLAEASAERLRDEVLRLLLAPRPATSLRALEMLGALAPVLPELTPIQGLEQNQAHRYDAWEHTLKVVEALDGLIDLLDEQFEADEERGGTLTDSLVMLHIGRYRQEIDRYLQRQLVPERPLRALLLLAAVFHDSGKAETRQRGEDGDWHFDGHAQRSAELLGERATQLKFSRAELDFLKRVVTLHGEPTVLARAEEKPDRRAVYRFFREAGPPGVAVCLHSLADLIGKYGPELPRPQFERRLAVVRTLLEAYYEQHEQVIDPPALLSGQELMAALKLKPGPDIGRMLEAIREAQAAGEVENQTQALELARELNAAD